MDLQAKYEELIRIREEEAVAKEEQTQELRLAMAEMEAMETHSAKVQAKHQEAMAQMTAYAKSRPVGSKPWLVKLPKPWRRKT